MLAISRCRPSWPQVPPTTLPGMKRLLSALLAVGSVWLAACGSSDPDPTPAACLQGANAYLTALEGAPEEARLEGSVPIGDCLVDEQPPGEVSDVGQAMIGAASELNGEARRRPGGQAATQLGYLVGAVEGAASATDGIHADLVLRLNSAARFSEGGQDLGAEFERTFGAGYAAAREAG